jgi:hypothetical protein
MGRILLAVVAATLSQAGCLDEDYGRLNFEPAAAEFELATMEYKAIWAADAKRILKALKRRTGLQFEDGPVSVIVYEGVSSSGYKDLPMRMRASYSTETKRGTLVHEMSHRLVADLIPKQEESHPIIFLFLYDVWIDLWGREFADFQVSVESRRRGLYDYESAWRDALALGAAGRAEAWQAFIKSRQPTLP